MSDEIRWPMAVYFDASILRKLPYDLASSDLAQLKNFATRLKTGLFAPEVAAREWIAYHQAEARKKYDDMRRYACQIGNYLGRLPLSVEALDNAGMSTAVGLVLTRYLSEAKITVIPTPALVLENLVDMAINYEKPFDVKDKGFKDALIVLTIEKHCGQYSGHHIIVASEDRAFRDNQVIGRWRSAGVEPIVVTTLSEALQRVDGLVDRAVQQHLAEEAAQIEAFLESQKDFIFDYILRNVRVSEHFIQGGFDSDRMIEPIERVLATRPLGIASASRGHVTTDIPVEEGRVPITFDVNVAFDVVLSSFSLLTLLGPTYPLKAPVDLEKVRREWKPETLQSERSVERAITLLGSVREEQGVLSDLRIEKALVY